MNKVLIITYYWPPGGGAGVQRWLKFVKYLREFGWEPIVYTVENGEMPVEDQSLMKDIPEGITVIKRPIREPYNVYKRFIGQKKSQKINTGFLTESKKPKRTERLAVWIRGNFFIPDARKFWIKPSAKYLSKYLKENPVDVIISSGPPHSMHLIAQRLKYKTGTPWVSDFRDPWTNIDYYQDLMLGKRADAKHRRLEREVLQQSDAVIAIGNTLGEELKALGAKRCEVITNGYDTEDVTGKEVPRDTKFTIAHIGSLVPSRNHPVLWQAVAQLVKEEEGFAENLEIKLVGKVDFSAREALEQLGLEPYLNKIDYLPHNEVMEAQRSAQVLLLLLNNTTNAKGILTGKVFEYLSAKRPILAIGPADGDAAAIIRHTDAGEVCDFNDLSGMVAVLKRYYNAYKTGTLEVNSTNTEQYSRKALTQKLAALLDQLK